MLWCRSFPTVRVIALWWSTEPQVLLVFALAMKNHPTALDGPFEVQDETLLPLLFVARLSTANGKILSSQALASGAPFVTPIGMARNADDASSVVHIASYDNQFRGQPCVGPGPFYHTVVIDDAALNVSRVCFDWGCDMGRHCNATEGARPVIEPEFGKDRLNGKLLAVTIGALVIMLILTFIGIIG